MLDALEACSTSAEMLAVLDSVTPDTEALAEYMRAGAMGSTGAEAVSAAAYDPAERVRIAKLAARARWRGHVKSIKSKIQNKYGVYTHASGRAAHLSSQFVDKSLCGEARKKSYLNGVPDIVHLHAALNVISLWQKSTLTAIQPSRKAHETGKVSYGRYQRTFRKNGKTYNALITSRIVQEVDKEILYSIEISKAQK